jgi:hypothetical protein
VISLFEIAIVGISVCNSKEMLPAVPISIYNPF